MYYRIVPGRHDLRVLAFTRVPRRRNEAVRSVENHERLRIGGNIPPQRIRTSDVAVEPRAGSPGCDNEKGNVIGVQPIGCGGYKRSKRVATNEITQAFRIVFFESWWQVHGLTSSCPSAIPPWGSRALIPRF